VALAFTGDLFGDFYVDDGVAMSLEKVNGAPTALAADDAKKDYMARVYKMTHAELFHELMRVHTASAQMINQLQEQVASEFQEGYFRGFMNSGEGYNGEVPYGVKDQDPRADDGWLTEMNEAMAERNGGSS
jgi:hypothetical protein